MGIYASALKHLIAAGVTGDALVTAIADMEESQGKSISSAALRQRRYRERNALRNSDESVTSDVTLRNSDANTNDTYLLKKESKITGSRFETVTLPDDWKEFCKTERPELNPEKIFAEFRDYWIAVPGARGRKLDWFATWRNRVRDKKADTGFPKKQTPKIISPHVHQAGASR